MVEYSFYTNTYKGSGIVAENWPSLEARAEDYIDSVAVGFDPDSDRYKKAVCAVAEAWQTNETGVLASQSVGSWSKSYKVENVSEKDRLRKAAMLYLSSYAIGVDWA